MGLSKDKVESDDMLFVRKEGTDHCGRTCAPYLTEGSCFADDI